ncbi:MAG TPA: hypothetical protein VHE08_01480 [Solirubrobacterales bacterium]|nr:hypothetical protein [Solirubrobacterales bacterium]
MRIRAKASSAGSTQRQASGLSRLIRGAFATRASFGGADGSGAPSAQRRRGISRRAIPITVLSLTALLVLVFAATAGATQYQRPFKEQFGSAAQPKYEWGRLIGVDGTNGDVLAAEGVGFNEPGSFQRYKADGTPDVFSELGENSIDGAPGPGGKSCDEEPASCDQTPQNMIVTSSGHLAVDESTGAGAGDIYLTQPNESLVDIFAGGGKYLGQLTGAEFDDFNGACGVVVDQSGAVYVSTTTEIIKYASTTNPVTNFDVVWRTPTPDIEGPCDMAVGTGPTAGTIFVTNQGGNSGNPDGGARIAKLDAATGEYQIIEKRGHFGAIAVDPTTGHLLNQESPTEIIEFAGTGDTLGPVLSRLYLESEKFTGEPNEPSIQEFATDASGNVYIIYTRLGIPPTAVAVYGQPAITPTVTVNPPSGVTGTAATLTGVVDPEGVEVEDCYFEYGEVGPYRTAWEPPVPCEGSIPTDNAEHAVHASIEGLTPNGTEYELRLLAENENGLERSEAIRFSTAFAVATEPATNIEMTSATLNGTLRPEGLAFENCFFEYGLTSHPGYENTAPCSPPAATIEPDFNAHPVSAAISGLQASHKYRFRLVATNSEGVHEGEEETFTTLGVPRFTELRARDASENAVTIEAKVNPSGFGTSYHFEWGTSGEYGNDVPAEYEPFIGSGTEPVLVTAKLKGLSPGTVYHYRVVATNNAGTAGSPDQEAETLNSCGLPDGRCFEMVSPREPGPVAAPGTSKGSAELHFQAGNEPGSLAYIVEAGFPGSTTGAEVLYRGTRGADGWSSTQLSTPLKAVNQTGSDHSGVVRMLARNLSCGASEAYTPLTNDPGAQYTFDSGGTNLYLHHPDGSYTAITKLPPEQISGSRSYFVYGVSDNCGKVVFKTGNTYPGVPVAGSGEHLYEWEEGKLRGVGYVPAAGGEPGEEEVAAAQPGGSEDSANLVSADGSRVFFTATRQYSPNPEEIGKVGVFVRENGKVTHDLSLSETLVPDEGAAFKYATADGSKVFFTANAGLTSESSSKGTDLYEYNLENSKLTDLSIEDAPGGAADVAGFVGASHDGSHVYFAASAQLVPGQGRTLAQNERSKTVSLYGADGGEVSFVGTVTEEDLRNVSIDRLNQWTSRVDLSGRYLMFESSADNTAYHSGGVSEVYLYDADAAGEEATVCVSCRQNGQPSANTLTLLNEGFSANPMNEMGPESVPRNLVVVNGKARVFFTSGDELAPGAPSSATGGGSLYEWAHGQVFDIASDAEGSVKPRLLGTTVRFGGASLEGTDLYFSSPDSLTWEDHDGRFSVYDARIGGGFPEPPPPPAPCDSRSEGQNSCLGQATEQPPATSAPGSSTFNGPGSPTPQEPKQKQSKKRKHHKQSKKKHHKKKHHKKGKKKPAKSDARHANNDRRAGK